MNAIDGIIGPYNTIARRDRHPDRVRHRVKRYGWTGRMADRRVIDHFGWAVSRLRMGITSGVMDRQDVSTHDQMSIVAQSSHAPVQGRVLKIGSSDHRPIIALR